MIKKFISIQNVGRFLDYRLNGDVELKKFSLFYAENGRGKSTLCDLLRSLQTNEASYLIGRTTLGETGTPYVKLLLDSGISEFDGENWTVDFPGIEIFDSTFVSENIYSGEIVNLDHRRNLYSVIIGKGGVELANQIDELDDLNRSKSVEIRDIRVDLNSYLPQDLSFDQFKDLKRDEDIESKIKETQVDLQRKKEADQIKKRDILSSLEISYPPSGVPALLTRELEGLSSEAISRVADQIEKHKMHSDGELWLSQGLDFVIDNECPFCSQNLDEVQDLIEAYKAFFVEAYKELTGEIEQKRQEILHDLGDLVIAGYERNLDQNIAGLEFWSRYCEVSLPEITIDDFKLSEILLNFRQASIDLLDKKSKTPLEIVTIDDNYLEAESKFIKLQSILDIYNKAVIEVNNTIEKTKADIETADLEELEKILLIMQATKKRHETTINDVFVAYDKKIEEKKELERKKDKAKNSLDAYSSDVLQSYEGTINNLLDEINAGFRIVNASHGYPGGIAATSYQILINDTQVDLGDGATTIDQPSFRNTLSSGDKNTLALVFFLARLIHDVELENKVVIFDDPFNSQDRFRKVWTIQKMKQMGETSKQVIILSHDDRFLAKIWDRLAIYSDSRKSLKLARSGECNTQIIEWDVKAELESHNTTDINSLIDFQTAGSGNLGDIVKKIRPVLETHIRSIHPSEFSDDNLGEIVGKIREADDSHSLYDLHENLDLINDYTCKYHHGDAPDETREVIDENELLSFVKKTLKIVGC